MVLRRNSLTTSVETFFILADRPIVSTKTCFKIQKVMTMMTTSASKFSLKCVSICFERVKVLVNFSSVAMNENHLT